MAELTPKFMDINNVYSGDELGLPYRDLISEGIVGSTDLAVTQRAAGANLSVDIAKGAAWVLGDTNVDAQPCYRVYNDDVVNLGISPDPSNPRKVLIVAQMTDETFAGTGRNWALVAIHGTPAASPAEPALPASALPLALVDVAAAAVSISNANITDRRVHARHGGQIVIPSVGVQGPAVSVLTGLWTSQVFDAAIWDTHGHWASGTPGRITCKVPGFYMLAGQSDFANNAGGAIRLIGIWLNNALEIQANRSAAATIPRLNVVGMLSLSKNDYVELKVYQDSGVTLNAGNNEGVPARLWATRVA